jgi:hypothetical protein
VLEEEEVVVARAPMDRALEIVGLPVGHATEPPDPQRPHASSASQSCVSSASFIACRNAAA